MTANFGRAVGLATTDLCLMNAQFKELKNDILAYQFQYPIQTSSGSKLDLIFSRPPERYSSAAPLTADARQRTVAELVSLPQYAGHLSSDSFLVAG